MSNSIVAAIYRYVIDDVVRNVHADFEGHGVDTSVLEELQRSWEAKIIQSRVASFPGEESIHSTIPDIYAHGGQYHGGARTAAAYGHHDYTSAAAMAGGSGVNINSAASLASIINNPESMAPSAASLASLAQSGRGQLLLDDDDDADSDSQQPQQQGHYGGRYSSGGGHHIPQNDGAADTPAVAAGAAETGALATWQAIRNARRLDYQRALEVCASKSSSGGLVGGQVDGASDDEDDDDDDESNANPPPADDSGRRAIASAHPNVGLAVPARVEAPEDAINSDLDDSDEDEDNEGGAEETEHIVLCQYEKVTRSKNKWKCVLRDGIMLINGRDYLFQKATGEFEWMS